MTRSRATRMSGVELNGPGSRQIQPGGEGCEDGNVRVEKAFFLRWRPCSFNRGQEHIPDRTCNDFPLVGD